MTHQAKLLFMCGKMAAGKSTLAVELAGRERAVLFVQDEWLDALYPGEIVDIATFIDRSARLRRALQPTLQSLLARGISVALDFPGNTRNQRAWFRTLIDATGAAHELHFIDASDALCKAQLAQRSRSLPPGTAWTSEAEFDAITRYFQPPQDDEGFHVIHHRRG